MTIDLVFFFKLFFAVLCRRKPGFRLRGRLPAKDGTTPRPKLKKKKQKGHTTAEGAVCRGGVLLIAPMLLLLQAVAQDGFVGWAAVLGDFLEWRDVVLGLAPTNRTLFARLKQNYQLACGERWWPAFNCGWRRQTQIDNTLCHAFPTQHVQELTRYDAVQVPRDSRVPRILCPALRHLKVQPRELGIQTRQSEVDRLREEANGFYERPASGIELWTYVADHTSWRFVAPRLDKLTILSSRLNWHLDETMVLSLLAGVCLGREAFVRPLRHLHLEVCLINDDTTVALMEKLAPHLRTLTAAVSYGHPLGRPTPWVSEVAAWPKLRELNLGDLCCWERPRPMPPAFPRLLHAPRLHTLALRPGACTRAMIGDLSPETLASLRHLSLDVAYWAADVTQVVDLAFLPDSLEHLKLHFSAHHWPELASLPSGLTELHVTGSELAAPASQGRHHLPRLRRLVASPPCFARISAPRLREIVFNAQTVSTDADEATAEALARVPHVTYRHSMVMSWAQPWITRIELCGRDDQRGVVETHAWCWARCPRLRALHWPEPTTEITLTQMRDLARERGLAFWARKCDVDDDDVAAYDLAQS